MTHRRIHQAVYLVGVAALGLAYYPVTGALGGRWLFLGVCAAYLLMLRLIGAWLARRWGTPDTVSDAEGAA
jgi:hypothetical protein